MSRYLPSVLDVELAVDSEELDDELTSATLSSSYNAARRLSFVVFGQGAVARYPIGKEVALNFGKGEGLSQHSFKGRIRRTTPTRTGVTVEAWDYISDLARSAVKLYKSSDWKNWDVYMAIKNEMAYGGLLTDQLLQGTTYLLQDDWPVWGWYQRKAWLDALMPQMVDLSSPTNPMAWRYAVRKDDQLELFKPDTTGTAIMALDENDERLGPQGITTVYDDADLRNTVTAVSSLDSTVSQTYEDSASIARYGRCGQGTVSRHTSRPDLLLAAARDIVELSKLEQVRYSVELIGGEVLSLGDIVQITGPGEESSTKRAVSGLEIRLGQDGLTSTVTLGDRALRAGEALTRILAG